MKFDRKTVLKILFIIFVSIMFLVALSNFSSIMSWVGGVLSVLTPFIIGLCLAFVINIPLRLIESKALAPLDRRWGKRWRRFRRPAALTLSFLALTAVVALLLVIIIPQFKTSFEGLATKLPAYMETLNVKISEMVSGITGKEENIGRVIDWQTISNALLKFIHSGEVDTLNMTVNIIKSAVTAAFNVILGLVFSIYILASKEKLGRQFRAVLYSIFKREGVDKFTSVLSIANTSFYRFVVAQCTEAVIIGLLCAAGMLIFGMPYVPVISCIIAISALIPVFGAFIGTALGAFIILLESPMQALWFIIYIIVLQQLETHIIYPKVMGKSVGLPGIWVLFAVTVGGGFFGPFGMLVSVPVCSVLYTLIETWVRRRLREREIAPELIGKKTEQDNGKE